MFKTGCSLTVREHPRQERTSDHSCLFSPPGVSPLCLFQPQPHQLLGKEKKESECSPAEMAPRLHLQLSNRKRESFQGEVY